MNSPSETAATASAVLETTTAQFSQDVLAASMKHLVLVDFWAPWCGPCKQLAPVLEKVVMASGGKVRLVKLNIDEHPQIPGQLGIQSIPAVIAFKDGKPVDGFMGAVPESQIKAFIEKHAGPVGPSPLDAMMEEAQALHEAGDATGASGLYAMVLGEQPDHVGALLGMAKLHLDEGDLEGARGFVAQIPQDKQSDGPVAAMLAAIDLMEQSANLGDLAEIEARVVANPNDHQARFDLALALAAQHQEDRATDALIEIVRRDRTWNEDGARKQLLQFFEVWGAMDERSKAGRRKLSTVIFR